MEYIFFYLLQVSEEIRGLCDFLSLVVLVLSVAILLFATFYSDMFDKELKESYAGQLELLSKGCKVFLISFVALFILSFIPTKQTLTLFGATVLSKRMTNEVNMNDKIKKLDIIIDLELDKITRELRKSIQ